MAMQPCLSTTVFGVTLTISVLLLVDVSLCRPVSKPQFNVQALRSWSLLNESPNTSHSVSESTSMSLPDPPTDDQSPDFQSPSGYASPSIDPSISGIPSVSLDPSFLDASPSQFPSVVMSEFPFESPIAPSGHTSSGKVTFRVRGNHEDVDKEKFIKSFTATIGMPAESMVVEIVLEVASQDDGLLKKLQKHAVGEADLNRFLRGDEDDNEDINEDDIEDDDNDDDNDDDDNYGDDGERSDIVCLLHPPDDTELETMIALTEDAVRYGHQDIDDLEIISLQSVDGSMIYYRESVSASKSRTVEPADDDNQPTVSHTDSAIHTVHFTLIGTSDTFDEQSFVETLAKNMGVPTEQLHVLSVVDASKPWAVREAGAHVVVTVEILHGPKMSSTGATTLLVDAIMNGDPVYQNLGIVAIQQNDETPIEYIPQARSATPLDTEENQPENNVAVIAGTVVAAFALISLPAAAVYRKRLRQPEKKVALATTVDPDVTMESRNASSMAIL